VTELLSRIELFENQPISTKMLKHLLFIICLCIITKLPSYAAPLTTEIIDLDRPVLAQQVNPILFLDTTVNTVFKGRFALVLQDKDILVKPSDLKVMGLLDNRGRKIVVEGETYISLTSLKPQLKFMTDETKFTLTLNANTDVLADSTVIIGNYNNRPNNLDYSQDNSLFLNYALNSINPQKSLSDSTFFTELGYSFNKNLLYSGLNYSGINGLRRGFSNLTIDHPDSLNRLVVGDKFVTTSSNLAGNPTIAGISYDRKFSLNPYVLTTYQDFSLRGAVTTPSSIDIYNNGVFVRRDQLPPGQYELQNLPLSNGSNNVTAVVRDAFGREQVINNPNYFSVNILKAGLSDHSFNVGFRRQDTINTTKYSDLLALASYRQGITDSLTAGVRLESSPNVLNIGGDVAIKLPFGEVAVEGATSTSQGSRGTAGALRYNYVSPGFGFSASTKMMSPAYANTTLEPQQDRSSSDLSFQTVFPIFKGASLNLQYQNIQDRDRGNLSRLSASTGFNIIPQGNLSLTFSHTNQANTRPDNSIFVAFSHFNTDNNSIRSLTYQNQNDRSMTTAQLDQPLGTNDGLGYRLQARLMDGQAMTSDATLRGQTSFGRYEFNYNRSGNQDNTYLNAAGGILAMGGRTFLTRPLDGSYALVEVPGMPNVSVKLNNNIVGKTGKDGSLIVTGLQPYYANKIGINPKDIPLDYTTGNSSKLITTPERSGVVIKFTAQRIQAFFGKILVQTATNTSLVPSYGQITFDLKDRKVSSPLGIDGEFYLENLPTGNHTALVEYEGSECWFNIDVPHKEGMVVELGRLTCSNIDRVSAK
jgi:outer membrane usher protein